MKACAQGVRTGTLMVSSQAKSSDPSQCRCGKGDWKFPW
jgi:hypothetical protein